MDFLSNVDGFEKVFWYIAIPFSIFFVLQSLLTVFGVAGGGAETPDFDGDLDVDGDGDSGAGFQILSLKNFIIFFTVFGWTGIVAYTNGASQGMTVFWASLVGILMMVIFASITYFTYKLAESGTFKLSDAKGKMGEVYIPIKAKRGGLGKVQVNIQDSKRELQAMTDDDSDITTGALVTVVDIINNQILLVTKG